MTWKAEAEARWFQQESKYTLCGVRAIWRVFVISHGKKKTRFYASECNKMILKWVKQPQRCSAAVLWSALLHSSPVTLTRTQSWFWMPFSASHIILLYTDFDWVDLLFHDPVWASWLWGSRVPRLQNKPKSSPLLHRAWHLLWGVCAVCGSHLTRHYGRTTLQREEASSCQTSHTCSTFL